MFAQLLSLFALAAQQETPPDSARREPASPGAQAREWLLQLDVRSGAECVAALERERQIAIELQQPSLPAWAGTFGWSTFYEGGHYSVAPASGMTASQRNCTFIWWNQGTIAASGARWFDVAFALPREALPIERTGPLLPLETTRFHLVTWRDRDFLVPEHRLLAFCNVFNAGSGARPPRRTLDACYASRSNPDGALASGPAFADRPELPPEFRKLLLDVELTGRVTACDHALRRDVDPDFQFEFETRAHVELDRADIAFVGLELAFADTWNDLRYGAGEIVELAGTTCTIAFRHRELIASPIEIGAVVNAGVDRNARRLPATVKSDPAAELAQLDALARGQRAAALERRARIEAELERPSLADWAGSYTVTPRGLSFNAAPRAGFVACKSYDSVGIDTWNHGKILQSGDDWLDVEFVLPHEVLSSYELGKRTPCTSSRFHLITWRDRDFLVPEHRLIAFCNAFNANGESSKLEAALRAGFPSRANGLTVASDAGAFGPPQNLPSVCLDYLLDHVVTGRVTNVDSSTPCGKYTGGAAKFETVFSSDVGRKDGLRTGMVLAFAELTNFGDGEVVEVGESTCRVAFRHAKIENVSALAVGGVLATRVERAGR